MLASCSQSFLVSKIACMRGAIFQWFDFAGSSIHNTHAHAAASSVTGIPTLVHLTGYETTTGNNYADRRRTFHNWWGDKRV